MVWQTLCVWWVPLCVCDFLNLISGATWSSARVSPCSSVPLLFY